jgi:AbrB family looped-hinge helix DNA binding protein
MARREVLDMLAELRQKSQITIPKDIVSKLALQEGDKLNIFEKDGVIHIMPVVVYPKKYLDDLRHELKEVKEKIAAGEQPVFDSTSALLDHFAL